MTIRIKTLGTFRVVRAGQDLPGLVGHRASCAFLVHLAVEGECLRDAVAALLWPDRDARRARHSLSQTLYELKRELGGQWLDVQGERLAATGALECDAVDFLAAVDAGRFEEALTHYRGSFLSGLTLVDGVEFQAWVEGVRSRLMRAHRRARTAVVHGHRAEGRSSEAVAAARTWVELEPFDDEAQHLLIELLAESGQRAAALRQFDRYATLLSSQLDLEPLDETLELVERIREGTVPQTPVQGSAVAGAPRVSEPAQVERDEIAGEPDDEPGRDVAVGGTGDGPSAPRIASQLAPGLEVVRLLGRGTMATVYLARQPSLGRLVAVKVLRAERAQDETARSRFAREARSAARISHPHVATVFSVGTLADGTPYIIMEYVHGRTLAAYVAARGALEVSEARRLVAEVASGLAAAHSQGIVHRDVRPANVMIEDPSGRAVLTDFGVAAILDTGDRPRERLTATGEIVGNPAYLSPEQLGGGPVSAEADVFSLGILAYECLAASAERNGSSILAEISPPDVPITRFRDDVDDVFRDVVERCLHEEPDRRPSAGDVARLLSAESRPTPVVRPPDRRGAVMRALAELRDRRVLHTLGVSMGAAVVVSELARGLNEDGLLPRTGYHMVLLTLPFAVLAAVFVAWFHGERGRQDIPPEEVWILGLVGVVWIVVMAVTLYGS